jgi:predicted RNA binding protein YcfA (HicA-like mRNA interferase family)
LCIAIGGQRWPRRRSRARRNPSTALAMKVRDVIRLLHRDGWTLVRTRGSHRQYRHPFKPGTVTLAGHPSVDIPPGTLNSDLRQAGLKP